MAASSTRRPRSAASPGPPASPICSMPARRWARCRSTSRRSAATCSPPPAASSCAGPRGTGFLYVRRDALDRLEPPMIDHFGAPWVAPDRYRLRDDARRFETWENNYAARLGLGVAVDYALALGLEAIEARCRALARQLRDGLRRHPWRHAPRPRPTALPPSSASPSQVRIPRRSRRAARPRA